MEGHINWRHMEDQTFNELVDALLVRHHTGGGLLATAIDGRGGDGGIDIDVTAKKTGQIVNIFQVKCFPEGFSGGQIKRRGQIKKSFDMAMREHHPPVWTLVVPRKVTAQERTAVRAMRRGRIVRIEFVGPVELDLLLAKYPEIRDHFLSDYAIKLLSTVNRAQAALAKAGDLEDESRRIQKQLDGRSQYWGVAFGIAPDGTYTETLYAKRSDAHLREPLTISFNAVFRPNNEELRLQFQAGLDYGMSRPLVLPAELVTSFKKAGASWFEEDSAGGEIRFIPVQNAVGKTVQIVALDATGTRIAAISGITRNIASGTKGATVDVSFSGGLAQLWRFPQDLSEPGQVAFEYSPTGHRARDVRSAVRFISALPEAAHLTIEIDGRGPILLLLNGDESLVIPAVLRDFIEDLASIENELDVSLIFPKEGVSNNDRLWARIVAKVLQGRAVPYPGIDGFSFNLTGDTGSTIEDFMTEGGAIAVNNPRWATSLLGTEIHLGDVVTYHPHVTVVAGSQHMAALRAGTAADRRVNVNSIDNLPFTFYSPSRMPMGQPIVTEGWGIIDAPEVANLHELQAMQRKNPMAGPPDRPILHI
jgi:hypothetical protein